MGRIIRGALVGFLFVLTVGVWPAGAAVSNVKVTSPSQSQVMDGQYASDGTPSGFDINLRGTATSSCNGFTSITFKVTGPASYSKTYSLGGTTTKAWSGGPSSPWNTQDLRNGVYTVRIDVVENGGALCNTQSGSAYVTAKLANPAAAPEWDGSPTAKSDGSANVTLSWKKNAELDVVEYHIFRQGPDGVKEAVVSATSPGSQGCSISGSTYTCTDSAASFPSSYDGNYSYVIKAMRSRPDYNSSEDPQKMCSLNGGDDPCVVSASSDVRQVTLTAPTPTPTPTPTDTPTTGPTATPKPGSSPTTGVTGLPRSGGNTNVLSFGGTGGGGGSSFNDFYSGTYDENLPYQPKSLIVGDGTSTPGSQVEAAAVSNPAPNFRTIMLPVAGGLLAFLSAAHVRRLLVHF
jgi:hypothetical protein